jgi:hypothetical protein
MRGVGAGREAPRGSRRSRRAPTPRRGGHPIGGPRPRTGVPSAGGESWLSMASCGRWCTRSSTSSGVPSRSAPGCVSSTRTTRLARVLRDHLPSRVQPRQRRPEQARRQEAAHRTAPRRRPRGPNERAVRSVAQAGRSCTDRGSCRTDCGWVTGKATSSWAAATAPPSAPSSNGTAATSCSCTCRPATAPKHSLTRSTPRSNRARDNAPGGGATLPHLGPGIGDGAPRRDRPPPQRRRVLRPSRPALAARFQREHQRPSAPVLPQGHRPQRLLRGTPRCRRSPPQHPPPQDTPAANTRPGARRPPTLMTALAVRPPTEFARRQRVSLHVPLTPTCGGAGGVPMTAMVGVMDSVAASSSRPRGQSLRRRSALEVMARPAPVAIRALVVNRRAAARSSSRDSAHRMAGYPSDYTATVAPEGTAVLRPEAPVSFTRALAWHRTTPRPHPPSAMSDR